MKVKVALVLILVNLFSLFGQEKIYNERETPTTFLGYGWVVSFPYDLVFIPSENFNKQPSVEDYFNKSNKYGIRINEEENAMNLLGQSKFQPIKWHSGEQDSLEIIPVIAYYSIRYPNFLSFKRDTSKVQLEEYQEMLQVYSYKEKTDSVLYRYGMLIDILEFIPLKNPR